MRQFVLDTALVQTKGRVPKRQLLLNIRLKPQYYAHLFQDFPKQGVLAIYIRNTSNLLHPQPCSHRQAQARLHKLNATTVAFTICPVQCLKFYIRSGFK